MKSKADICSFIIENIRKAIDDDWETATLKINVADKFSSYNGYYHVHEIKKSIKVSRFDPKIDLDFIDLHSITTSIEPEIERWNIAVFTLDRSGKYDLQYFWNQELYDSVYKSS